MESDADHANTASNNARTANQHETVEAAGREDNFLSEDPMASARAIFTATERMVNDRKDLHAKLMKSEMEKKGLSKKITELNYTKTQLQRQMDILYMEKLKLLHFAKNDTDELKFVKKRLSRAEEKSNHAAKNQTASNIELQNLDEEQKVYEDRRMELYRDLEELQVRRDLEIKIELQIKHDGSKREESKREESKREESKREESKREESKREESKREESKREEIKRELQTEHELRLSRKRRA